jgi:hypothetical protein
VSERPLPTFLYIGAAKCGSTWIYRALRAHPEVFVPPAKDICFFDQHYGRGLEWYSSFFRGKLDGKRAWGELSHNYLYSEEVAERIHRDLPTAVLLASIRNPVERAVSSYQYRVRNGTVRGSFSDAVTSIPGILTSGLYARHLKMYQDMFTRDRVRVLIFDDLQEDPHGFAAQLYRAVGVDEGFVYRDAQRKVLGASVARVAWLALAAKRVARTARQLGLVNLVGRIKSSSVPHLLYRPSEGYQRSVVTPAERAELVRFYAEDIGQLEQLIDRDLSAWREGDQTVAGAASGR